MDYSNGKIYTIRSSQTDKYYIGSTTTSLAKRLSNHKGHYNAGIYLTSAEIFKYGDAYIELLEDYPCCSKNDLNKREGQLIRQYKNECVNKNIAGRTKTEYKKQYDDNNKDNKKQYYEINKEEIKEKSRLYRIENREQINQRDRERYKQKNNIDIV